VASSVDKILPAPADGSSRRASIAAYVVCDVMLMLPDCFVAYYMVSCVMSGQLRIAESQ
jgi:hypothetical protein